MQQLHLLRLFGFIGLLLVYMIMFDPSVTLFVTGCRHVADLDLHYLNLVAVIGWLIGTWGLLLFLNSGNNKLRLVIWALFIMTSLVNFCYFKITHSSFSLNNIDKFGEVAGRLGEMANMDLVKLIGLSIAFFVAAKYIKPLNIGFNKIFLVVLVATLVIETVVYSGNNLPLPSVYVVASVVASKYLLAGLAMLKAQP